MAAEAQHAPRVARETNALALPPSAMSLTLDSDPLPALGAFNVVPSGFDVVPIRAHVAVFKPAELGANDLEEGGIYVYEHQRPVALSPRADARRICTRKVVRIYRNTRPGVEPNAWWARDLDRPHRPGDGPYHDWGLASLLVGRVVGVYVGTAFAGAAS